MTPRSGAANAQVEALRALADELEAGTRKLSPTLAKAIERELSPDDDVEHEELTPENWEQAWANEIDLRLTDYRSGKSPKVDLGGLLDELRDRVR